MLEAAERSGHDLTVACAKYIRGARACCQRWVPDVQKAIRCSPLPAKPQCKNASR